MPAPHPPEFRRRALDLVRLGENPVAAIAKNLGITESCPRNWMAAGDVEAGRKEGLTSDERAELVRLRRENRVQAMEIELLKRASAYFRRSSGSRHPLRMAGLGSAYCCLLTQSSSPVPPRSRSAGSGRAGPTSGIDGRRCPATAVPDGTAAHPRRRCLGSRGPRCV